VLILVFQKTEFPGDDLVFNESYTHREGWIVCGSLCHTLLLLRSVSIKFNCSPLTDSKKTRQCTRELIYNFYTLVKGLPYNTFNSAIAPQATVSNLNLTVFNLIVNNTEREKLNASAVFIT
jgi:hypothetical protein